MVTTILATALVFITIILTGFGPIYALYLYKQDTHD